MPLDKCERGVIAHQIFSELQNDHFDSPTNMFRKPKSNHFISNLLQSSYNRAKKYQVTTGDVPLPLFVAYHYVVKNSTLNGRVSSGCFGSLEP